MLEVRIEALRGGRFDVADWTERQLTTGRDVTLVDPAGAETTVRAVGVDPTTGALVGDAGGDNGEQHTPAVAVPATSRARIPSTRRTTR